MLKTKLTFFIVIVVFFVLLFVTNPTMDKYEQFVHQQIIQETTKQDGMSRILGTLFGGVASNLISNATLRHDYLLLSVFEAQLGNDHLKVIGILNHFIVLNAPTFKAANNNDLSATSKNEPVSSKPIYQEEKIPRKEVKKDIIQRDFKAGPITVSTYGKCSPIMNDCESYAVLNSGNQSLKINSVGSPFQPISQEDISWVDNRYVTINYADYGNCGICAGIEVAGFNDGKLYYLGRFRTIENGYLTQVYDVLEFDSSVGISHALTPMWILYSKDVENKAVLDIQYTCLVAKENYEKDKKKLLGTLATPRKLDAKSYEFIIWTQENVTAPLLGTLALARYCGWKNESLEILDAVKANHDNLVTPQTLQEISATLSQVEPASNGAKTFQSHR